MTRPRSIETNQGIQGEITVASYDRMERRMRDKGWIATGQLIASGIDHGHALEIGPGPGYLGLEWLKHTHATTLSALDISPDMVTLAQRNAREYGLSDRVEYFLGSGCRLPFEDAHFDAVFSNGSLHEWADPCATFDEISRVLRPGGKVFISDLRRDMSAVVKAFLWLSTRPTSIRPGLLTSIHAAYTPAELQTLAAATHLSTCTVRGGAIDLTLTAARA